MTNPYAVPLEELDGPVAAEELVVEVRPRYGLDPGLPLADGGDADATAGDGD